MNDYSEGLRKTLTPASTITMSVEVFRPFSGCLDMDIQEPVDSPPQATSIADEMDSIHEENRAWPL
jgi:hypothetical protein